MFNDHATHVHACVLACLRDQVEEDALLEGVNSMEAPGGASFLPASLNPGLAMSSLMNQRL